MSLLYNAFYHAFILLYKVHTRSWIAGGTPAVKRPHLGIGIKVGEDNIIN